MSGTFKPRLGARIRWSFDVDQDAAYDAANTWEKGEFLVVNADGTANRTTGDPSDKLVGPAMENRTSAADDMTSGNGGKVSLILDEAVIETNQGIKSGVSFDAGDKVYLDTNLELSDSSSTAKEIGKAIEGSHDLEQAEGFVTFLFTGN